MHTHYEGAQSLLHISPIGCNETTVRAGAQSWTGMGSVERKCNDPFTKRTSGQASCKHGSLTPAVTWLIDWNRLYHKHTIFSQRLCALFWIRSFTRPFSSLQDDDLKRLMKTAHCILADCAHSLPSAVFRHQCHSFTAMLAPSAASSSYRVSLKSAQKAVVCFWCWLCF